MRLPPKDPLRDTRYAAFFVKPPGDDWEDDEDEDEIALDEEDAGNDD